MIPGVCAHCLSCRSALGECRLSPRRSNQSSRPLAALSDRLQHPLTLVFAQSVACHALYFTRDLDACQSSAEQLVGELDQIRSTGQQGDRIVLAGRDAGDARRPNRRPATDGASLRAHARFRFFHLASGRGHGRYAGPRRPRPRRVALIARLLGEMSDRRRASSSPSCGASAASWSHVSAAATRHWRSIRCRGRWRSRAGKRRRSCNRGRDRARQIFAERGRREEAKTALAASA